MAKHPRKIDFHKPFGYRTDPTLVNLSQNKPAKSDTGNNKELRREFLEGARDMAVKPVVGITEDGKVLEGKAKEITQTEAILRKLAKLERQISRLEILCSGLETEKTAENRARLLRKKQLASDLHVRLIEINRKYQATSARELSKFQNRQEEQSLSIVRLEKGKVKPRIEREIKPGPKFNGPIKPLSDEVNLSVARKEAEKQFNRLTGKKASTYKRWDGEEKDPNYVVEKKKRARFAAKPAKPRFKHESEFRETPKKREYVVQKGLLGKIHEGVDEKELKIDKGFIVKK